MRIDKLAVREHTMAGYQAVTLTNGKIEVTVLPAKGGEIHGIVLCSSGFDVLWKAPWGLQPARPVVASGSESEASWMDNYAGGWQGIFPNGGDSCTYRGAPLGFHGEASVLPWQHRIESGPDRLAVCMEVRLLRSPFRLTRTVTLRADSHAVEVDEIITNESREELHTMWGHHPAFATDLLDGGSLETSASTYEPGQPEIHIAGRIDPGRIHPWPLSVTKAGLPLDQRQLPSHADQRSEFGFLSGFEEGRYRLTNHTLGIAVECTWDLEIFPYLWLWIEWGASKDYPWYGMCHVAAVEPFSSIPGTGLAASINRGTALLFKGGQSRTANVRLAVWTL